MTKQRGATPYCREHTLFSPSHGGKFPLGKIAENFPPEISFFVSHPPPSIFEKIPVFYPLPKTFPIVFRDGVITDLLAGKSPPVEWETKRYD